MSLNKESGFGYKTIVAGLGAVYEENIKNALSVLGSERIIFDVDASRVIATEGSRALADSTYPPFDFRRLTEQEKDKFVLFVATPNHIETIESFAAIGMEKFIVEKPLVNDEDEAQKLLQLIDRDKKIKVYPMDFYIQKATPLLALSGRMKAGNPRWLWLEPTSQKIPSGFNEAVGSIEGVEVSIIEGGDLGLPDLAKRTWLETDEKRGGMLLDLGTHALVPLFGAGVIDSSGIKVNTAKRYVFGQDRASFVPAHPGEPEMYAEALLSARASGGRIVPVRLAVGKTFHEGGLWRLAIRGSKGDIVMGIRTGQHLTLQQNDGQDISLSLKKGLNLYKLAFQEANMYFSGELEQDTILKPMIDAISLIDEIKQKSNE